MDEQLPEWAEEQFASITDNIVTLLVLSTCTKMTSVASKLPQKLHPLSKKIVERESQQGHPFINTVGTIMLWTYLEAFAKDLVCAWLLEAPGKAWIRQNTEKNHLKMPLGEFLEADEHKRVSFVVDKVYRDMKARGAERLGGLIQRFGIRLVMNNRFISPLDELHALRDFHVHRSAEALGRVRSIPKYSGAHSVDDVAIGLDVSLGFFKAAEEFVECVRQGLRRILIPENHDDHTESEEQ